MMPDPKWLDALKLPLKVTLAVALSASVLLWLNVKGILDLGPLSLYSKPILTIIAVVFWILSIISATEYLLKPANEKRRQKMLSVRRAIRKKEQDDRQTATEKAVLARLDHLSSEEIRYVVDCLKNGTPTFYTYAHSPPVAMLLGKGLAWTPGGTHHQDHYPFTFFDFVWAEIVSRKGEFVTKHETLQKAEIAQKEAERRGRR